VVNMAAGHTLYRVEFKDYMGGQFHLDTTDSAKIGPWLAEMFGLFPYQASMPTSIQVVASPLGF
jgi:hypothetical protein